MHISLLKTTTLLAFLLAMTGQPSFANEAQLRSNYLTADKNGDGNLSYQEFKKFIDLNAQHGIGRAHLVQATNRYQMAFNRLDTDANSIVSPAELRKAAETR